MNWEIVKEYKNAAGYIHELKCSNCGHKETTPTWIWPRQCYVCEEIEDSFSDIKEGKSA